VNVEIEKKERAQPTYATVDVDLGNARDNTEIASPFAPARLVVWDLDGSLSVRINRMDAPLLPLHVGDVLQFAPGAPERFWHLYATNAAQAGKKATLVLGTDPLWLSRGT
jgi:hypothetical protein